MFVVFLFFASHGDVKGELKRTYVISLLEDCAQIEEGKSFPCFFGGFPLLSLFPSPYSLEEKATKHRNFR
jgi:hypothetical protein